MKLLDSQHLAISVTVSLMLFAGCVSVGAQQPKKVPRIGYLTGATPDGQAARIDAFRQGLRELGYVEGKNVVVEYRYAELKPDRLPALAAELVHLKVDVIVTSAGGMTRAAKEATHTIPIVMAQDNDPVANGFVASLARPGGNVTGLSNVAPEISGKQLELLKEIVPRLSRVAVLGTSTMPGNAQLVKEIELAAGTFGVKLHYVDSVKVIGQLFCANHEIVSLGCSDIHRLTFIRLAVLNGSRFKFSLFRFTVRASKFLFACAQMDYYSVGSF